MDAKRGVEEVGQPAGRLCVAGRRPVPRANQKNQKQNPFLHPLHPLHPRRLRPTAFGRRAPPPPSPTTHPKTGNCGLRVDLPAAPAADAGQGAMGPLFAEELGLVLEVASSRAAAVAAAFTSAGVPCAAIGKVRCVCGGGFAAARSLHAPLLAWKGRERVCLAGALRVVVVSLSPHTLLGDDAFLSHQSDGEHFGRYFPTQRDDHDIIIFRG